MREVILVYPSLFVTRGPYVPHSILSLATYLVENGYGAKIIDGNVDDAYLELQNSLRNSVICVGISAMTGSQILNALKASEVVRRMSMDVPIIWGGVHPSLLPHQTISDEHVDIVVRGEGEETLLELVQHLESGKSVRDVRGITFKENGRVFSNPPRPFLDINSLPPTNYKLINVRRYFSSLGARNRAVNIHTSRGCPYRCGFCYNVAFNKQCWRGREAEKVVEEVEMLVGDYGINGLNISDDNFFVSVERVETILQGIKKFDLLCQVELRIDQFVRLDGDFLSLMAESGLIHLGLGAESGSQRILDLIKKDMKVEQTLESARICGKYGFKPLYTFMIGLPWEQPEEVESTLDLIDKLSEVNPEARAAVLVFAPYPGTELYDLCLQAGINLPSSLEEWWSHIPTSGFRNWIPSSEKVALIAIASLFAPKLEHSFGFSPIFLRKGSPSSRLFGNILLKILQRVEEFRWKRRFWNFPIEAKLIRVLPRFLLAARSLKSPLRRHTVSKEIT